MKGGFLLNLQHCFQFKIWKGEKRNVFYIYLYKILKWIRHKILKQKW